MELSERAIFRLHSTPSCIFFFFVSQLKVRLGHRKTGAFGETSQVFGCVQCASFRFRALSIGTWNSYSCAVDTFIMFMIELPS